MPNTEQTTYKNTSTEMWLDVTPGTQTATYAQIGEGVESATPSYNPTVTSRHFINMENPKSEKTGVAIQYALSMIRVGGDAVNDYIAGLSEKTGNEVKSTLIKVDKVANTAKKYEVLIVVNNDGTLQGGENQAMDCTLYVNSKAVDGNFANGTFTPTNG